MSINTHRVPIAKTGIQGPFWKHRLHYNLQGDQILNIKHVDSSSLYCLPALMFLSLSLLCDHHIELSERLSSPAGLGLCEYKSYREVRLLSSL